MAKLSDFFGTHTGTLKIYVAGFDIGTGQFRTFGDFEAEFDGSYQFAGRSGGFSIAIALTDQNSEISSGSCTVSLNGSNDATAQYQVHESKLRITTALNDHPIDLYKRIGGTQVDNISGHNLWIGQWG